MESALKITLTSWAPFIGGAEVAVERLALGLGEAGHDVLLVVGTDGEALQRFRDCGIRCEFVPQQFTSKLKWMQYRKSRNQLVEILRREQSDLVHSNDLPTHQMTSDAARRLGIPRICHHRWIFEGKAIDWLNKFDAEKHLFVSRALMEMLSGASDHLRASPGHIVYDGLPLPPANTIVDEERRYKLGLSIERLLIVFAGQIVEHKGVKDLLQGWSLLKNWHGQAELVIVGDDLAGEGAYRREMENLANELQCPVQFVGFKRNVMEFFNVSDLAIVPSHSEPLGLVTLEAMACGKPVIGSNVGGLRETIAHNKTGLLVPPKTPAALAEAIGALLGDTALRGQFGAAARRRCEEMFSLEAHVRAVLHEYKTVLKSAATGARS